MSANQPKPDHIAEWSIDKNGREFLNFDKYLSGKVQIYSEGFLKKLDEVFENKFPQAESEDEQESANAFNFEDKIFSISQFKGKNGGLTTLIYKGASKNANNKPLVKPEAKQRTLDENMGSSNKGTSKYTGTKYVPKVSKIVIPNAVKDPRWLTKEEVSKDCPQNGDRALFIGFEDYNTNGDRVYLTGIPVVV